MRKSFDEWALDLAVKAAERSTCRRRATGAIAVDAYKRIIGIGYNGQPRGFKHCIDEPCPGANDESGNTSRCEAIHAEENMIMNSRDPYAIHKVYLTTSPCFHCGLLLANLPNLLVVIYIDKYTDTRGLDILARANIGALSLENLRNGASY